MHGLIFETSVCYWQNQPGFYLSARIPNTRVCSGHYYKQQVATQVHGQPPRLLLLQK
jgi:hypothetical protein